MAKCPGAQSLHETLYVGDYDAVEQVALDFAALNRVEAPLIGLLNGEKEVSPKGEGTRPCSSLNWVSNSAAMSRLGWNETTLKKPGPQQARRERRSPLDSLAAAVWWERG